MLTHLGAVLDMGDWLFHFNSGDVKNDQSWYTSFTLWLSVTFLGQLPLCLTNLFLGVVARCTGKGNCVAANTHASISISICTCIHSTMIMKALEVYTQKPFIDLYPLIDYNSKYYFFVRRAYRSCKTTIGQKFGTIFNVFERSRLSYVQ